MAGLLALLLNLAALIFLGRFVVRALQHKRWRGLSLGAAAFVVLVYASVFFWSGFISPRESAWRSACKSNLRYCARVVEDYHEESGKWPGSLGDLTPESLPYKCRSCPFAPNGEYYLYFAHNADSVEPNAALLCDRLENHNAEKPRLIAHSWWVREPVARTLWSLGRLCKLEGGCQSYHYVSGRNGGHVVFGDGHVEWVDYETLKEIISKGLAKTNP